MRVERKQFIEVQVHALVADRPLDGRAVRLDEIQCQHGRVPSAA